MKQQENNQILMLNPLYLFSQEVKSKTLKKQSIQNAFTIALAMTSQEIVNQLLPFFTKIMVQQNNQIRVIALQSIFDIFQLSENQQQKCRFFEWTVDILCVFQQQDIRTEAYKILNLILKSLDQRTIKITINQAIKELIQNPQKNIRQVTLELIYFYYKSEQLLSKQDEKQLFQLLSKYKTEPQDKIILAKGLSKIIQLIPAIQTVLVINLLNQLIDINQAKIKVNLVEAVLKLRQKITEDQTLPLLQKLIKSQQSSVKCSLIQNIEKITKLFKSQNIQSLIQIFKNFSAQSHEVKNTILKVLQNLPIDQVSMQQIKKPLNSMQLKNSLIQSLCRINDIQTLKKITSSSDNDFKAKIYPKLPCLSELHIQIVDCLLQQKNFRSKLTIIQNIQKRVDDGESGQILLQILMKYLGDKTATVRIGIQKLICKILKKDNKISEQFRTKIRQSLQKQNWFQRQAAYMLLRDLICQNQHINFREQQLRFVKQMVDLRQEKVSNIITTINQIKQQLNFI